MVIKKLNATLFKMKRKEVINHFLRQVVRLKEKKRNINFHTKFHGNINRVNFTHGLFMINEKN